MPDKQTYLSVKDIHLANKIPIYLCSRNIEIYWFRENHLRSQGMSHDIWWNLWVCICLSVVIKTTHIWNLFSWTIISETLKKLVGDLCLYEFHYVESLNRTNLVSLNFERSKKEGHKAHLTKSSVKRTNDWNWENPTYQPFVCYRGAQQPTACVV